MKRLFAAFAAAVLLSLTACGGGAPDNERIDLNEMEAVDIEWEDTFSDSTGSSSDTENPSSNPSGLTDRENEASASSSKSDAKSSSKSDAKSSSKSDAKSSSKSDAKSSSKSDIGPADKEKTRSLTDTQDPSCFFNNNKRV